MFARFSARAALTTIGMALAFSILSVPHAEATQVLHRSVSELSADAGLVVEGRVMGKRSFWNDSHTRILTEVEIAVGAHYKGSAPQRVTVVQMGGVVDGVRMTVHGSIAWSNGEEVLLFLEPSLPGRFRVSGFSQGKFAVETDPQTGERVAVRASLAGTERVGDEVEGDGALRMPVRALLQRAGLQIGEGR